MIDSRSRQEQREANLVANRLRELSKKPLRGLFDRDHLCAVHAYIFQDLPQYHPGKIRNDSPAHYKLRCLEDESIRYRVDYLSHDVPGRIAGILSGPAKLGSLGPNDKSAIALNIAGMYGDLDHAHAFYEGNSRTLREFTRCLALEGGFELDWASTKIDAEARNCLYMARDIAVIERTYPGLTRERGDQSSDIREYEASLTLDQLRSSGVSLKEIVSKGLGPAIEHDHKTELRHWHMENDSICFNKSSTKQLPAWRDTLVDRLRNLSRRDSGRSKGGRSK